MTAPEVIIVDPEKVPGDASLELKRKVVELWPFSQVNPDHFASSIGARLELVEISVVPKREDAQVIEARIVAEIDVLPGAFWFLSLQGDARLTMLHTRDAKPDQFHARWMHCIFDRPVRLEVSNVLDASDLMANRCTSVPTLALEVYHGRDPKLVTVSQSLGVQFLGPSKACVSLPVTGPSEVNTHPLAAVTACGW